MNDMTRSGARAPASDGRTTSGEDDAAERALARVVAVGLPLVTLAGAIGAGIAAGPGSSLLVLASGALLGTIALLWASLRTLSGDAPLPANLDDGSALRPRAEELTDRKRRVLRALKDLEGEHELGKIDDDDYENLAAKYREEAKDLLRELDRQTGPARAEAERIVEEYLSRRTRAEADGAPSLEPESPKAGPRSPKPRKSPRFACTRCGASNEADASFCKRCGAGLETSPS